MPHRFFAKSVRWLPLFALAVALPQSAGAQPGMPQPLPPEILADTADTAKAEWLQAHVVANGPVKGGIAFSFPDDFYRSKLILLGESHGVAAPQILDLELLVHLNQRIGLTDYLGEFDPVQADYLNRYVAGGEEALLTRVFDYWTASGAQWGNRDFESKVRAIRALNATLPVERRIRFVGIDAIQDWTLLAEWIADVGTPQAEALSAAPAGQRAATALAALGDRKGVTADMLRATLSDILADKDRDTIIFDSYARAIRGGVLGDRPAYGLWGMFHVMQGGINQAQPFAARVVASDLPAASATTSIALMSLDSAVQVPIPFPDGLKRLRLTDFNIDGPFVMVKGSATLRAVSHPQHIRLFHSGAADSPIASTEFAAITTSVGQDFVPDDTGPQARRLTQYIGVFRDSDWAAPREE